MFLLDIFFKRVDWRRFWIGDESLCQTCFLLVNVWLVVAGFSKELELGFFESLPSEIFYFVFLMDFFYLRVNVFLSGLIFFIDFCENLIFFFIIFLIIGWAEICIPENVHGAHHSWSLDLGFGVSGVFGIFMLSSFFNFDLFLNHFFNFCKLFFLGVNMFSLSNLMRFEPFCIHPIIQRVKSSMFKFFHWLLLHYPSDLLFNNVLLKLSFRLFYSFYHYIIVLLTSGTTGCFIVGWNWGYWSAIWRLVADYFVKPFLLNLFLSLVDLGWSLVLKFGCLPTLLVQRCFNFLWIFELVLLCLQFLSVFEFLNDCLFDSLFGRNLFFQVKKLSALRFFGLSIAWIIVHIFHGL